MNDSIPIKRKRTIFFEVVFTVTAIMVSFFYVKMRFLLNDGFPDTNFLDSISSNTGMKPWQYRILVPYVANILYQSHLMILNDYSRIYKVIEGGSVFLLILSFRHYVGLFVLNKKFASVASLFILFILPFHYFFPRPYYPNYWYDTPSLLFFTLGLFLMYREKWILYYILYIFATLNRETTCFLTMIFLFTSLGKEKIWKIGCHCGAQFLLWMLIKGALFILFAHNDGPDGFEWYASISGNISHIADNLEYFSDIKNYRMFFSIFGFTWIPVLFYHHLIRHDFVKRSLIVTIPFFIGMMFVSNIYELRVFGELIPLFTTAFILILEILLIGEGDKLPSAGGNLSEETAFF